MVLQETEKKIITKEEDFLSTTFLETRSILIFGEINQESASKVCRQLLILQHINNEPIYIYLNSQGGHVEAGDTIHDMIRFIKPRVIIVGTGWVASAGITIYLAAEKNDRYSLPNTRYMIHQPSGGASGYASDVKIEANEIIKMRKRINKLISERTGQSLEQVTKDTDRNFWLTAEESIEYGIVGSIINSIDEILV